ncbi:DUF2333 family protein [Photobacterium kishitanii]|uniref:DUF2333 family protein n=1 Tax=Photobacterium kishitanii TaxID=318456 RepID=UPI0015E6DF9C|nr:DUF2333 family protein [Photobacterium kishitanii]
MAGLCAISVCAFSYIEYVSFTPDISPLSDVVKIAYEDNGSPVRGTDVPGVATTSTLANILDVMIDKKNGGFQSSGILAKLGLQDNITSWETGVRYMAIDFSQALQLNFSKQNSNQDDDPVLRKTVGLLTFPATSYWFPSSESQYAKTLDGVRDFESRLLDSDDSNAQFVARVGTLTPWLGMVSKRLDGYNQKLLMSQDYYRVNTNLAGDREGGESKTSPDFSLDRTPWVEVDNVFFEARGACWALIQEFEAIASDFNRTLKDKNNLPMVEQIIADLKKTQEEPAFFMVLNGGGYGFTSNYSLTLASYIGSASRNLHSLIKSLNNG